MTSSDHTARCAACNEVVARTENEVQTRTRDRSPDGPQACSVVLCEPCRYGVVDAVATAAGRGSWAFDRGDVVREEHEQFAPGGFEKRRAERRIKRLLREFESGDRYYHVETDEGGTHLYGASTLERSYESIPIEESGVFSDE